MSRRYVIQLSITTTSRDAATRLARNLGRSLSLLPEYDAAETTVIAEGGGDHGDQVVHHRLFCDRLLTPGRRCGLRTRPTDRCAGNDQSGVNRTNSRARPTST